MITRQDAVGVEVDHETRGMTRRTRSALTIATVGAAINMAGLPWPWVSDFFDADADTAAQVALVDDRRLEFAFSFGLLGLGTIIAGVGLLLLSRTVEATEAADGRMRRAIAARIAGWLAGLSALAGLSRILQALLSSPEHFVDEQWYDLGLYVAGMMFGLTVSLLIIAFLGWGAPPVPRWTLVTLALGSILGPLSFVTWYVGLFVFGVANLVVIRRHPAGHAWSAS